MVAGGYGIDYGGVNDDVGEAEAALGVGYGGEAVLGLGGLHVEGYG